MGAIPGAVLMTPLALTISLFEMSKLPPFQRMKPKAAPLPNAAERDHWERIADMGCLVCGGAATIHHVTARIEGGRYARDHKRVVPLCPPHHQKVFDPKASDPISVEGLGHAGFYEKHGYDLWVIADREWENSRGAMEEF